MDFIGRLPETKLGNKYIITAIDYATRWVVAKAVKDMTSTTVVDFLYNDIIMHYGVPIELFTDRGKSFLSEGIQEYYSRT